MGKLAVIKKYSRKAWKSPYAQKAKGKAVKWVKDEVMKDIQDFKDNGGFKGLRARRKSRRSGATQARLAIGEDIGYGTLKRHQIQILNMFTSQNCCQLYSKICSTIPKQTVAEEPNMREGNTVDLRGINFVWMIKNMHTDCVYFHIAVVVPKNLGPADVQMPVTNFFRDEGVDRGIDFSTGLGSNIIHNRPLNIDIMDIICRYKFKLGGNSGDTQLSGKNQLIFKKYVPINRQIRYDQTGLSTGDDPYVLWWWDETDQNGGGARTSDKVIIDQATTLHFKDVLC